MSKLLAILEGRFTAGNDGPGPDYEKAWANDPASGALGDAPPKPAAPVPAPPPEEVEDEIEVNAEKEFEEQLCGIFTDEGMRCQTFEDAGIMTRNRGLVVRTPEGKKFQVTIVEDNRGY